MVFALISTVFIHCNCNFSVFYWPTTKNAYKIYFLCVQWIKNSFLKNKASLQRVKSIFLLIFGEWSIKKGFFYVHCSTSYKLTAQTDKNCGNENKNCLTSKNPILPTPFLTMTKKHVKLGNFLDKLWVWILSKHGSTQVDSW